MDNDKAKFILQSFRPDGADATGPEFAEALGLAAADRELGAWLARERAADAAFATMLNEVEIPEDLRESIFTVLAGEEGPIALSETDASIVGALASLQPPEGLRDQILHAMRAEAESDKVVALPKSASSRVSKWLAGAAVAAAVVLGAFVALQVPTGGVSPALVEASAVGYLEAGFSLDQKGSAHAPLREWLSGNELPAPGVFPVGLESSPAIGCKELKIGGKAASLICFKREEGVVHLIILRRKDVDAVLPALAKADCHGCEKSGWSLASWSDEEHAMFLLGKMEPETLKKVLF